MKEKKTEKISPDVSKQTLEASNKLNINNTLLMVVAVLIVLSAIQLFQFQRLASAFSDGAIKVNSQPAGGTTNLPSQVGGCG